MIEPTPTPTPAPDLLSRLQAGETVLVPHGVSDLIDLAQAALRCPLVAVGPDSVRIEQNPPEKGALTPAFLASCLEATERVVGRCVSVSLAIDEGERVLFGGDRQRLEVAHAALLRQVLNLLNLRFIVGRASYV
jgi:hypothetical protein